MFIISRFRKRRSIQREREGQSDDRNLTILAPHAGRENTSPHLDKLKPSLTNHGWKLHLIGWDREKAYPKRETRERIHFEIILRGGGFAKSGVAVWFPLWVLRSCLKVLRERPRLLMAMDFEAALPTAIASVLRGQLFIYNVRDNFSLRRNWSRPMVAIIDRVDRWIMGRAAAVIFPDECRVPQNLQHPRIVIIRNCAPDIADRTHCQRIRHPKELVVYAMGYLRATRGIGLLIEAVHDLDNVVVLAAGACPEPQLRELLVRDDKVDYRGPVPMEEALELCGVADVVFTFYDPSTRINQLAVSNKWSDAMMMSRPILVNTEVLKSSWLVERDVALACRYDVTDLRETLRLAQDQRETLRNKGINGRSLYEEGYRWEVMERRMLSMLEQLGTNRR